MRSPFRYLAHNGEINTITGNRQWARARAYKFHTLLIPDFVANCGAFVNESGSDSSSLDNMLELFLNGDGYCPLYTPISAACMAKIIHKWDDDLRAFFDFNSMHMEPLGWTCGDPCYLTVAMQPGTLRCQKWLCVQLAMLSRPILACITCASEIGIWDYQPDEVLEKGRNRSGELMVIDTYQGRILHSA